MGDDMFKTARDFLIYFFVPFASIAILIFATILDRQLYAYRNQDYTYNISIIVLLFLAYYIGRYFYKNSRWGALLGFILGSIISVLILYLI